MEWYLGHEVEEDVVVPKDSWGGNNFYSSIGMSETSKSSILLWNDFQQFTEEESRINHMDDIFFKSLLEDDEPEMVNSHKTYDYIEYTKSMEESVLNDLERVTAQFTDKTRICFRDAFYRLAETSKQPITSCQDTFRAGETQVSESKTNVIDRAVANLMFHKFDYEDNDNQQQVVSGSQQTDHNDVLV